MDTSEEKQQDRSDVAIYRYGLKGPGFVQVVVVPEGARPRHFGYQSERRGLSVWYEVTPGRPPVNEVLQVVATGQSVSMPDPEYIGTVVMPDGFHTWHLFRRGDR